MIKVACWNIRKREVTSRKLVRTDRNGDAELPRL